MSGQIIDYSRMTMPPLFLAVDAPAYDNCKVPLRTGDLRRIHSFSSQGKGSWTRNKESPAAIAFRVNCVKALHERSVDESEWYDLFSSLDLRSRICFIIYDVEFHISSIH